MRVPITLTIDVGEPEHPAPTDTKPVLKACAPQRYVLGVAYHAGRRDHIATGVDGARDFFTKAELEKAAWSFIGKGMTVGLFHADGTEGHATVVESYIYRGPDWTLTDTTGQTQVVKAGDWLVGAQLDPVAWDLWTSGRIDGWSPQGRARRVPPRPESSSE